MTNAGDTRRTCRQVIMSETLQTKCNRNTNPLPHGLLVSGWRWSGGGLPSPLKFPPHPLPPGEIGVWHFSSKLRRGLLGPEPCSATSTSQGHAGVQQARLTACPSGLPRSREVHMWKSQSSHSDRKPVASPGHSPSSTKPGPKGPRREPNPATALSGHDRDPGRMAVFSS